MKINYKIYEEQYFNDIKIITLISFELTAFNTDRNIPSQKAGEIAWELWCKPVLLSDKKRYCIVATVDNKAVGYLIYGLNAEYSNLLKKRIGYIILTAVNKNYRKKFQIAKNLLKYVINLYKNLKVDIISVGTDLDNLPAVINYINNGFRPILNWSTFRYYFQNIDPILNTEIQIICPNKINIRNFNKITRPLSLLIDNQINSSQKNKLTNYIKNKIKREVLSKKILPFQIRYKNKDKAFITLFYDKALSNILNKQFYRIYDIILLEDNPDFNTELITYFLNYIKNEIPNIDVIEVFTNSNNWTLIEVLTKTNFLLIHNAVTLHHHLTKPFISL